jgi:uncharacterized protein YecE (DUF72 family)
VLIQLPPTLAVDEQLLQGFLDGLPEGIRPALEFRHASWETEAVLSRLDAAGAAWVLADRPGLRVPMWVTGGWSYVRFHQGRRTSPAYTREKLRRWAERLARLPARDLFVYFNNDPGGAAARDADTLRGMLVALGADVANSYVSLSPGGESPG